MRLAIAVLLALTFLLPVSDTHAIDFCAPRPPVALRVENHPSDPAILTVLVTATNNPSMPFNAIQSIRFLQPKNARIVLDGQEQGEAFSFTFPKTAQPQTVYVSLKRINPNGRTQATFIVKDQCGDWPTFVGSAIPKPEASRSPAPLPAGGQRP